MTDLVSNNLGVAWFFVGCALIAVEAYIFGMSTAVLLFAGVGALMTALMIWVGLLPATVTASFAAFTISSAAAFAALWVPFKKLQNEPSQDSDKSSDFVGYEFEVDSAVTSSTPGKVRYSGIEWKVELDEKEGSRDIAAGERVKVSSISAGLFRVVPVNS